MEPHIVGSSLLPTAFNPQLPGWKGQAEVCISFAPSGPVAMLLDGGLREHPPH